MIDWASLEGYAEPTPERQTWIGLVDDPEVFELPCIGVHQLGEDMVLMSPGQARALADDCAADPECDPEAIAFLRELADTVEAMLETPERTMQ